VLNLDDNKFLKTGIRRSYKYIALRDIFQFQKKIYIHRLVALAFIPNELYKPYVHHKDENKLNNNINNLMWVTSKENTDYHLFKKKIISNQINIFDLDQTEYKKIGGIENCYKII
jgi:hypothetical protein